MDDNVGKFYILNGELKEASNNVTAIKGCREVYEVIRIINGVPLYLKDHMARMEASIIAIGEKTGFNHQELSRLIKELLEANKSYNCNVKVISSYLEEKSDLLLYISKSYYPKAEEYKKGVGVGLIQLERYNPEVKMVNHDYKKLVSQSIQSGGYFEVLLYSKDGSITEGSKSNVFFVMNGKVYTAPGYSVLKGITRQYVMEACRRAGYEVVEQFIKTDDLEKLDGVFLSGTSIKVLPVASVDKYGYHSSKNPVILAIGKEFNDMIEEYLKLALPDREC